jgi:hypothetical protein
VPKRTVVAAVLDPPTHVKQFHMPLKPLSLHHVRYVGARGLRIHAALSVRGLRGDPVSVCSQSQAGHVGVS